MRRLVIAHVLSATAALLAACGTRTSAPQTMAAKFAASEPPVALDASNSYFIAGETMTFELSLGGVVGGASTLVVGDPGMVDGRRVVIVRSRVESAGVIAMFKEVRDDITSWIDLDSGHPISMQASVKFGDKESLIETQFADGEAGSFELVYSRKGRRRVLRQQMPANQAAFEAHAVLGALRAWQAKDGAHAYFYVLAGRRLWQNTIRLTGRGLVKTVMGTFPAIRIDGVARRLKADLREDKHKKPRHFTLWLSDDDNRLPVLVTAATEYGDLRVELVDYERPQPRLSAR